MNQHAQSLESLRDKLGTALEEVRAWSSSEFHAAVRAYTPFIESVWEQLRVSHLSLASAVEETVRITPEGAFVVALIPYLVVLRFVVWALRRVLRVLARVNISLDPLAWCCWLARTPLRLPSAASDVWGRWFFPRRANRAIVERTAAMLQRQTLPGPEAQGGRTLAAPPLMSARDTAELIEDHGLTFLASTMWKGHLQTNLPLDTDYMLVWQAERARWTVQVDDPGLLVKSHPACWTKGANARVSWHPEQGLPGTATNPLAFHASFLAHVRKVHDAWGVRLRGSLFTARASA